MLHALCDSGVVGFYSIYKPKRRKKCDYISCTQSLCVLTKYRFVLSAIGVIDHCTRKEEISSYNGHSEKLPPCERYLRKSYHSVKKLSPCEKVIPCKKLLSCKKLSLCEKLSEFYPQCS